jgi:hypothetical protein
VSQSPADPTVPGRSCGACTLCCKVMGIVALGKPMGVWCRHCSESGCTIYGERPRDCRVFYCAWLATAALGEEWRPDRSKLVLAYELGGARIAAYVDPDHPDAWRREPFYSALKQWARAPAPVRQVVACLGRHTVAILPDRDVDLGIVGPEELIVTLERRSADGVTIEAVKMHKDDPRLKR